jgi:hypothetical protein
MTKNVNKMTKNVKIDLTLPDNPPQRINIFFNAFNNQLYQYNDKFLYKYLNLCYK